MATRSNKTTTLTNTTQAPRGLQWFSDPADSKSLQRIEIPAGGTAEIDADDWKALMARKDVERLVSSGQLTAA